MKRTSGLSITGATMVVILSSWITSGCMTLHRSSASGYSYRDAEPTSRRDQRLADHEESIRQLGYRADEQDLSSDQAEAVNTRTALRKAERLLSGKSELEQYYANKAYMRGDGERLEFLSLDSLETRQRWLNAKGISGASTAHPPTIQALIEVNDITTGMTKAAVRDSWGEPELVEVSGNPIYGNERWHFQEQTSSEDGYQTQRRVVYFENGRVTGWESR